MAPARLGRERAAVDGPTAPQTEGMVTKARKVKLLIAGSAEDADARFFPAALDLFEANLRSSPGSNDPRASIR